MRQVALIEDKLTKQPFAVLILSGVKPVAFGALGQGEVWANWANSENMSIDGIQASLDLTLTVGSPQDLNSIDIGSLENSFSENTFAELKNEISKKALMRFVETKSAPPYFPANSSPGDEFNIEDDYSVEENILNWPITDIGLASIDVAYKQIAVNYKTRAFAHDVKNSSLTLQVKGVRAVWDTNMPGGGGWRCPDDTPFGGQFTNRLGTGCTFGMVRRIGHGLMAASLRDIQKLNNDPKNVDKPMLLRAGQRLEAGAEKRRVAQVDKFERRVARRVQKLDKRSAKEKLRAGAPTGREIYSSLNPDMTRRDRARIAAGTVIARVGNDMRTDAFNTATSRRATRRIPTTKPKPKNTEFQPNKKIPLDYRHRGGILPSKLSDHGSILLPNGLLVNFDEMIDPEEVINELKLLGVDTSDVAKTGYDLSKLGDFITSEERLDILNTAKAASKIAGSSPIKTIDDYRNTYLNYRGTQALDRKETDDLLSPKNSFFRRYAKPDRKISEELRSNGGTIPLEVANNGIYQNEATGEIFDFQTMIDVQAYVGNRSYAAGQQIAGDIMEFFDGELPDYITPNELFAIRDKTSIAEQFLYETRADGSRALSPDTGRKLDPLDKNDALVLGDEVVNAMLATGNGRSGSGKRAEIARRMRQTADNLVNPDRRKNRRIAKINTANYQRDVVNDRNFKRELINQAQLFTLIPPNSIDPKVGRGRFGQDNQGSDALRKIFTDVLNHVGIEFLGYDDAVLTHAKFDKPLGSSARADVPTWDKDNVKKASNLTQLLQNNSAGRNGRTKEKAVYETFRTYAGSPIRETFSVVGETDSSGTTRVRHISYLSRQPVGPNTRDAIINEQMNSSDYFDVSPTLFKDTLAINNYVETGTVDIYFDDDGNLLQVKHEGVNPYYGGGNMPESTLKTYDGSVSFTNGLSGAMATYTTGKGVYIAGGKTNNQNTSNSKRKNRGSKPSTPGIVQRFGESVGLLGPPPTDKERAIRELQGRRPRPTDARRERASKFLRRMASRIRQEPVNPKDEVNYASFPDNYPLNPRLGGPRISPTMPLSARHIYNGDKRVDNLLQNFQAPPGVLPSMWQSDETNFTGILELNNLLSDTNRKPLLPDSFDDANQNALQEVIDEWSKSFNDPNGAPLTQGAVSNFGLTVEQTDSRGNTIRYSNKKSSQPPIYIEDASSSAAHFMDDDGHHLVSALVVTDSNGNDEVKYIASDYVKEELRKQQTPAQNAKPTFIQRVIGKFRKPQNQQQQAQPSTRARVRAVTNSSSRSGLRFSKTTTGPELPDASTLSALDKSMLSSEMQKALDHREESFRKKLGKAVTDTNPLTEDELLNWIDNLRKTDPRRAGIEETNLHNFLVLTDFESSQDHNLINDLKPSLRKMVMDNAKITGTGVNPTKRRPYTPYGPNRGATSTPGTTAPSPVPVRPAPATPAPAAPSPAAPSPAAPSTAPAPVTPPVAPSAPVIPTSTPVPRAPGSGPTIVPGVGNAIAGIAFDPASGMYINTITGEFVEDLSNLPIDQHAVYTPRSVVVDGGPGIGAAFPNLPVDMNSALTKGVPYLRVAPGIDPNTPSLEITAKPKTTASKYHYVGVIGSFAKAVATRLKQHDKSTSGRVTSTISQPLGELSYIDTRGSVFTADAVQPVFPLLKDLDAGIASQLVANAAAASEILSEGGWLSRSISSYSTAGRTMKLVDGSQDYTKTIFDRPNYNLDRLGLDPELPIGEFYLPDASYRNQTSTGPMIKFINRALQLEHAVNNPKPGSTQQELDALRRLADTAWVDAQQNISSTHSVSVDARDRSLESWRRELLSNKKRNKGLQDTYIFQGAIAEQAAHILEKHIASNPSALAAIENATRTRMEDRAKRSNERVRRVAARQAQGLPRAEGLYDNQPSILDPWNSSTPPQAIRTASEITKIRDDHRAQTLFEFITHGAPSTLNVDQLEMLDVLGQIYEDGVSGGNSTVTGPAGSRVAGIIYPDAGTAHLGAVWQYNGFNSFPVLASRDELLEALKEIDADGNPRYIAISRGVGGQNRDSAAKQIQMVTDALTGDRFIPGQGGTASGKGEYWSQKPSSWSNYHGHHGGTMVGIISQDQKLTNRKMFGAIFGSEGRGTDGETYESLWAIYNALGAPGAPQGTNSSHGDRNVYGIAVDSLKPNANTGVLTSQQLVELDSHIDRLTAKGSPVIPGQKPDSTWGNSTLEGMYRDGRLDSGIVAGLFPGNAETATMAAEEIQEIEETRDLWNAWLQQRMAHSSDLMRMLQDEALGGQAAKDNNKKIIRALRTHLYMRGENIATMMGYDGFGADGVRDKSITSSQIWKHAIAGDISRIIILNRSAMIMEDKPIRDYVDYTAALRAITYPNGKTAEISHGNWN